MKTIHDKDITRGKVWVDVTFPWRTVRVVANSLEHARSVFSPSSAVKFELVGPVHGRKGTVE